MTTHKEALTHLKAITEAFGPGEGIELDQKAWSKLHSAIKEALMSLQDGAQPAVTESHKQEPVAFLTNRRQRLNVEFNATGLTLMPKSVDWKIPLYTTTPYVPTERQRTWVSLDNDDIKKIAKKHKWHESNVEPHLIPVYRSLETKLKEKNT